MRSVSAIAPADHAITDTSGGIVTSKSRSELISVRMLPPGKIHATQSF